MIATFDRAGWLGCLLPLSAPARKLGQTLAVHADRDGYVEASQGWLAKEAKLSRTAVADALRALRQVRLVDVARRGQADGTRRRPSLYRLTMNASPVEVRRVATHDTGTR